MSGLLGPRTCGNYRIIAIFSKQGGFDWFIKLLIKPTVDILTFLDI